MFSFFSWINDARAIAPVGVGHVRREIISQREVACAGTM